MICDHVGQGAVEVVLDVVASAVETSDVVVGEMFVVGGASDMAVVEIVDNTRLDDTGLQAPASIPHGASAKQDKVTALKDTILR